MSDTPETDAVSDDYFNVGFDVVDGDFARKLERERDEALKLLAVAGSIHGLLPFPE